MSSMYLGSHYYLLRHLYLQIIFFYKYNKISPRKWLKFDIIEHFSGLLKHILFFYFYSYTHTYIKILYRFYLNFDHYFYSTRLNKCEVFKLLLLTFIRKEDIKSFWTYILVIFCVFWTNKISQSHHIYVLFTVNFF